jgi:hypothetical protein
MLASPDGLKAVSQSQTEQMSAKPAKAAIHFFGITEPPREPMVT